MRECRCHGLLVEAQLMLSRSSYRGLRRNWVDDEQESITSSFVTLTLEIAFFKFLAHRAATVNIAAYYDTTTGSATVYELWLTVLINFCFYLGMRIVRCSSTVFIVAATNKGYPSFLNDRQCAALRLTNRQG